MSEAWVPLDVADCDPDPLVQFRRWFDEAAGLVPERDAVALATSDAEGRPHARMVLLRHVDGDSIGWYTNYRSSKGQDLAQNPHAAVLWYCEPLGRQVRFEGAVAPMTAEQSDAYFASRARGHQLGAHASAQSEPIASRAELVAAVEAAAARFEGRDVARPDHWGGYTLTPELVEFWQHRADRLHDRVRYVPDGRAWRRERLAP